MPHENSIKNLLITGGLGDFLAVDSFLSKEQKLKINKIVLATRAAKFIKSLFDSKNNFYKNLKKVQILDYNFSKKPSFHSKQKAKEKIRMNKIFWDSIYDGSISNIFNLIRLKKLKFCESSFLNLNVSLKNFDLPKKFILILPFSTNQINSKRNFDEDDWKYLEYFLRANNIVGVCIGTESKNIPSSKFLINLIKSTSAIESIELLKKSKGYIGIDSWISVLAPKLFNENNVYIKSNSKHCYRFSHIYFKPFAKYSCMFNNLRQINIKFQKF